MFNTATKMAGWKEDTRKLVPALEYEVEVSTKYFNRLSKHVWFEIDAASFGYGCVENYVK